MLVDVLSIVKHSSDAQVGAPIRSDRIGPVHVNFILHIYYKLNYLSLRRQFQIIASPSGLWMRGLYNPLDRRLLQSKHFLPISITLSILPLTRNYNSINRFSTSAIMGGSSSSSTEKFTVEKSDEEWRAILSPEQVLPQVNHRLSCSFVFSGKRERKWLERGNMNILKG